MQAFPGGCASAFHTPAALLKGIFLGRNTRDWGTGSIASFRMPHCRHPHSYIIFHNLPKPLKVTSSGHASSAELSGGGRLRSYRGA